MADLAVASQLQQWSFNKPSIAARPDRTSSDSSASSPNLCNDAPETLRIETPASQQPSPAHRKESIVFQDRYMSSEEALSPVDDGSDSEYDYDDVVVHDPTKECKARTMSISRWDKGRSCDMAVMVSYAKVVGRPKVVELDCRSPTADLAPMQHRSASVANLPIAAISQIRKDAAQRLSMKVTATGRLSSNPASRATTPPVELEPRRPSTSYSPSTKNTSTLNLTDSASASSSFRTASSTRSISPAVDELLARPSLHPIDVPSSARSSVYIPSQTRSGLSRVQTTQSYWTPPTPSSPASHAFLSSDPYEASNKDSSSPIIKPAPHKRLRSISMKLALAKIAITNPSKKTYDTRVNGKMPPTPSTPYTPLTPQTAPLEGSSSFISPQKLRRASTILRPKSRGRDSMRGPSPDLAPPVPTINTSSIAQKRMTMGASRMQARGANEREPTLVLPPCPSDTDDDPMASFKNRTLKKRKSLMSLMDSL
ncbi:hypothetical protein HBH56_119400 [Parastagonospora nodorum]|uniref:Uncharacterized protein n=2 Tax=Phaeosphaeria nodorum (strain SN15 / ATCC MYA-4574 / FGSC 10173) TaxID=321614 RepID=A0A7U2NP35_PHANO|nr:hypothetical protein SNOG_11263 [Parastagonospora nodorum SN15]KAH3912792.1 hypothetical protein HBH56_119400 [Parastagonospora nodorum]EAT81762.1 hypothetical protein SNOG_11263 [Parastagonospora nodorum SN15]KAH3929075.1 hypothetical protein HBH54_129790 [Parastagonospora nodorum]KAH3959772.1 hypothetical protein HBH51_197780 [Parastagonospora nodorum]KAH4104149.1 hypothetical protein HBH46_102900 [Parastagonospora nodorum]